jgi:hypothetical protein
MLEQLTYVQIGDRLNISSEGARAIVKRNRLPRSHDKERATLRHHNQRGMIAASLDA